mgnify:CR=1 FL=1
MPDKKVLVNYTNRDFNSIKRDLEEHAKRYYPDSYKDFSENTFGSYILDTVSYVGDMLSFYLDYQVNESFLETAVEYENVKRHTRNSGYKSTGRPAAFGMATFYVLVPAALSGLGPNLELVPILKAGTEVASEDGATFILIEDVDFANSKNEIIAARFSNTTGKPTEYAIRAHGQVRSTVLYRNTIDIGEFTRFRRVRVGPPAIAEIISVRDSDGHEYFEVEHLAQDVIYMNTTNPNAASDGVPQIIKPKIIPRRYVMVQDDTGTYIQFGYGSDESITTTDIAEPSQVSIKMTGRPFITDYAFDPTQLLDTNTLGVAPANTTLTIIFSQNESDEINVGANALNTVVLSSMTFPNDAGSASNQQAGVRASLEVSNDNPIVGSTSVPTSQELRYRTYAARAAQMRSVTKNDYEAYIYMMPANFGSVKRASVINDPSSTNRRLSVYVISEDGNRDLVKSNSTLKENIKQWLNKNKMLNDNIDIYDAKILNIGFDYEIIVDPTRDKTEVLNSVQRRLVEEVSKKMYIGEPFYLTRIYNIINKVDGVIDTTNVKPTIQSGTNYASAPIGIDDMKSLDGTYLKAPKNVIFEIKFFNSDVRGSAV